jgi:hypothetical protein
MTAPPAAVRHEATGEHMTFHPPEIVLSWPPEFIAAYLDSLYELINEQSKVCVAAVDFYCDPVHKTSALVEAVIKYRLPKQEER